MKSLFTCFLILLAGITLFGQDVWVNGYTRSNGTHVKGHYRTRPNHTKNDNFSTMGNVNPYTGEAGKKLGGSNYKINSSNKYQNNQTISPISYYNSYNTMETSYLSKNSNSIATKSQNTIEDKNEVLKEGIKEGDFELSNEINDEIDSYNLISEDLEITKSIIENPESSNIIVKSVQTERLNNSALNNSSSNDFIELIFDILLWVLKIFMIIGLIGYILQIILAIFNI